jgi:hypothetical protein
MDLTNVELPKRWSVELDIDPATISRHLCQIEKANKLGKRVLHGLNENQTNCH